MRKELLLILVYALCSASGLLLLKIGVSQGTEIRIKQGILSMDLNLVFFIGMLFYIVSFLLSLVVMSKMQLNFFYPLAIGMTYLAITGLSTVVLRETMAVKEWIGSVIILIGVFLITWRK